MRSTIRNTEKRPVHSLIHPWIIIFMEIYRTYTTNWGYFLISDNILGDFKAPLTTCDLLDRCFSFRWGLVHTIPIPKYLKLCSLSCFLHPAIVDTQMCISRDEKAINVIFHRNGYPYEGSKYKPLIYYHLIFSLLNK